LSFSTRRAAQFAKPVFVEIVACDTGGNVSIVIPSVIMTLFDDWCGVYSVLAFVLALLFPLGHCGFDLLKARAWNLF
jgi:hypothetical protein